MRTLYFCAVVSSIFFLSFFISSLISEFACFSVIHHRHWMEKPVNDVRQWFARWRHQRLYHVFIYYLCCVALTINFFSRILFLYCSYNVWQFTHSVKILISDCLLSSSVRQKHQHMGSIWFMHPWSSRTSEHSDRLSGLLWFMHPWSGGH